MKKQLYIFKIGGGLLEDEVTFKEIAELFAQVPEAKLIVHGGGRLATDFSKKMGIEPKMIKGRRVTDLETLRIVVMVYAGWVNKNLVATLQLKGTNAMGFSGADANLMQAYHRPPLEGVDYGWIGEIEKVNSSFLQNLIEQEVTPVISPITHDKKGQLFNTNADTIASVVAQAMSEYYEVNLWYCFEKKGVLENIESENSVIETIQEFGFQILKEEKKIHEGMIPKLKNGFDALNGGASEVKILHYAEMKKLLSKEKIIATTLRK